MNRTRDNLIGTHTKDSIVFYFYFEDKASEDEIKVGTAIFKLDGILKQVSEELLEQLNRELSLTCRTELVKAVYVDVSDVYYPHSNHNGQSCSSPRISYVVEGVEGNKDDINMDFYTDYVIQRDNRPGMCDALHGFTCCSTLGRFSRKDKKFREISNSMISCCELL